MKTEIRTAIKRNSLTIREMKMRDLFKNQNFIKIEEAKTKIVTNKNF